ncbi:MAG: hypothetical protein HGA45_26670 [Chloroflexales bacterium]|nr:hypothetical protein [Chloroflexales bacterium]
MSLASNNRGDIHLNAKGVRAVLSTLDGLAGDLEVQMQRLRSALDEAEAGDRRHGYLDKGLRAGYEAASLADTARAELGDALRNATATVAALEGHDLGAAAGTTTVTLPTLASLPAAIAIPLIGADLGAAVERADESADAVGEVELDTTAVFDVPLPADNVVPAAAPIAKAPSGPAIGGALTLSHEPPQPPAPALDHVVPGQLQMPAPPAVEEKKSWWDSVTGWFEERWNRLADWQRGILKGIATFVIALAAVAIVALIITAIAAVVAGVAFSGALFLAVFTVVGIVALVIFVVWGLYSRFQQLQAQHGSQPWYKDLWDLVLATGISLLDVLGITGIIEAITGKELITGRPLTPEERAERATIGILSLLALIFARAGTRRGGGAPKKPSNPEAPSVTAADSARLARLLKLFGDDIERLQVALKRFGNDPERLERALAAFGDDTARLEKALAECNNDGALLERLLTLTRNDAALLETLLANRKITNGAELEQLLTRYRSVEQIEPLLASPEVASAADLVRLAQVMEQAGLPNATKGGLSNEALIRYAQPKVLAELEATAKMQASGRIKGLDKWIEFSASKRESDLENSLGELREARRLANENPPNLIVNVAGDAEVPLKPGTTDEVAASFDLTVEDSSGTVHRSVEVTSVTDDVSTVGDLTRGVRHGTDKVEDGIANGRPIPGQRDVTIRMRVKVGQQQKKGRIIENLPDGTVNIRRSDTGEVVRTSNIYNEFETNLGKIPSNNSLERVTLVDPDNGQVIAVYERTGNNQWKRRR